MRSIGKSCPSREYLMQQICLLKLFVKIIFSQKFPNLIKRNLLNGYPYHNEMDNSIYVLGVQVHKCINFDFSLFVHCYFFQENKMRL